MIINIRGTHGSGKSTLVRRLLDEHEHCELGANPKKPDGYRVNIPWLTNNVYVVGSYRTACGGCDAIQPYALIWPRVLEYHKLGHVIFEGALISSTYGSIGEATEPLGDQVVFAYLDTPVETCIKRITLRRLTKGNTKPVDPKNTEGKYRSNLRVIEERLRGRRVVKLDYRKAYTQLMSILVAGNSL